MELNKVLAKVRALVAVAEHPDTPEHEAKLAREKADALMLKFAIDEITAEQGMPSVQRSKPGTITVSVGQNNDIIGYVAAVASSIARHCRCKIRNYSQFDQESREYFSTVYGFESDLAYFEVLYTTIRLHMLGALMPKINADETLEQNAYRLHNAGFNWLEIARMYGWQKASYGNMVQYAKEQGFEYGSPERNELLDMKDPFFSPEDGHPEPSMRMGSRIKRAYVKAEKAAGGKRKYIAAGGSKSYRLDASQGYLDRISSRLRQAEHNRQAGADVILRSRFDDLENYYREANASQYTRCPACSKLSSYPYDCDRCGAKIADAPPPCKACQEAKSGHCRAHPADSRSSYRERNFNRDAYQMGVAHADTADISGNASGMSSSPKKSLS